MSARFLLDQGLPRSTCQALAALGLSAVHVADLGMSAAKDQDILRYAREHACVVVTLDADFHQLLAVSDAPSPSVVRIRIEGLTGPRLAALIRDLSERAADELSHGSAVTIDLLGIRIRRLPLHPRGE